MSEEAAAVVETPVTEGTGGAEPSLDDVIAAAQAEIGMETPAETPAEPAQPDPVDAKRKEELSKDGTLSAEKLSAAFAKLRAQERRSKARAQELEAQKQAILRAREEVDGRVKEATPLLELAKTNPTEYLLKSGWTRQQIADFIVSDGKIPTERLVAEADERIRKQLEEVDGRQKEIDRRQREFEERVAREKTQGAAREYESLVYQQVQGSAAQFPLVMAQAALDAEETGDADPARTVQKAVLNYVSRHYKQQVEQGVEHPKALAPRDALAYFEKRLERQKQVLAGGVPGQAGAGKAASNPGAGQPRALTNGATSERGVTPLPNGDDEEARQLAVEKLLADADRGVYPD